MDAEAKKKKILVREKDFHGSEGMGALAGLVLERSWEKVSIVVGGRAEYLSRDTG